MSDAATKRMIAAYIHDRPPTMFLSGFFRTPPQNFYNSEEVEIDIERGEEDVSIVVQDLSAGYRMNSADLYTNKKFKAPIHQEAAALNGFDLTKRIAGQNPFEDVDFQASATVQAFRRFRKIENKIRRSIELQASQVLQTGTVTLTDSGGNSLYTIDYQPKNTHFVTTGTSWNAGGNDPLGDLNSLGQTIRADGLTDPDTLIFGDTAWDLFINNADVQTRLELRRGMLGEVAPEVRGSGANYMGSIWIGNYRYNMWTYSGRYKHPQTGVSTAYVESDKVIMMSSTGRLDGTFGAIPSIVAPDSRVLPFLPSRMQTPGMSVDIDLFTNAWVTPDGSQLFVGAGARPLMIPTAIDTFGCLDTII